MAYKIGRHELKGITLTPAEDKILKDAIRETKKITATFTVVGTAGAFAAAYMLSGEIALGFIMAFFIGFFSFLIGMIAAPRIVEDKMPESVEVSRKVIEQAKKEGAYREKCGDSTTGLGLSEVFNITNIHHNSF